MKHKIKMAVNKIDRLWSPFISCVMKDQPGLLSFIFHGLHEGREKNAAVDQKQFISLKEFREFICYFLDHGYQFISADQLNEEVDPHRKYCLITFDDGYANNLHTIPVLEQFNVPATFFISTNYIKHQRSFWWDILYREAIKDNWPLESLVEKRKELKRKTHCYIFDELSRLFGKSAFTPWGETDRPLTPDELKTFSQHPLVSIGNHTADHAILTNYNEEEISAQIKEADEYFRSLNISPCSMFSYPNGKYNHSAVKHVKLHNFNWGISAEPKKNYFKIDDIEKYQLGRFTLSGDRSISRQCAQFRCDYSLSKIFNN